MPTVTSGGHITSSQGSCGEEGEGGETGETVKGGEKSPVAGQLEGGWLGQKRKVPHPALEGAPGPGDWMTRMDASLILEHSAVPTDFLVHII